MNLYVFMSRSFRKRLALKKLKMWVFFLTRLGQVLYNVGSFSKGGNIMENKLQAKGYEEIELGSKMPIPSVHFPILAVQYGEKDV